MAPGTQRGPAASPPGPVPGAWPLRRLGQLAWAGSCALLVLLLGVVLAVEGPQDDPNASRNLLLALAVASSLLGIVLSRLVPPRIPARHTGAHPGATALVRSLVGWALCEGVAFFPLIAHVLVHDHRLLAVAAVDLLALLSLYPGEDAWARLAVDEGPAPERPR